MDIVTKTVYVSKDGRQFDTEEECIKWENRKFRKDPWHLTNSEIAGLIEAAFETLFVTIPKEEHKGVSLFIREKSIKRGSGSFDFLFNYDEGGEQTEYSGRIVSYPELKIRFYSEPDNEDDEPQMSKDWNYWSEVPIRRVYKYLESISFYDDQDQEPAVNPSLREDWTRIYYKNYFKCEVSTLS